jgi:hypothetical protein
LSVADTPTSALEFATLAELRKRVKDRGPRRWLLRGIWPAGAYGGHAAEMKAQKSWNAIDLAVSVASDTSWLDHVPIDDPGPVIIFWGEGDDASLVRRIEAVCATREIDPDELPIVVCCRAPHLSNKTHREEFDRKVAEVRPRLVILDPFYLTARGAKAADLYEMGALLEHPQRTCVEHGSALLIVTHYNRREGRGPVRITGAGPAEWGRVLILATVKSRRTDPATQATTVIAELDFIGGEIPDRTLRVSRSITAEDPDDLDSPLHYEVTATEAEPTSGGVDSDSLPPAAEKLLEALTAADGPCTSAALVDAVAEKHGHGLRRETVSRTLNDLARRDLADSTDEGGSKLWFATENGGALS